MVADVIPVLVYVTTDGSEDTVQLITKVVSTPVLSDVTILFTLTPPVSPRTDAPVLRKVPNITKVPTDRKDMVITVDVRVTVKYP